MPSPLLAIGLVTYEQHTALYLPWLLTSLTQQTYQDFQLWVCDNSVQAANNNARLVQAVPDCHYHWAGGNLGFAQAYNLLISQALQAGARYFLALNCDTSLEPRALELLVAKLEQEPQLAAVTPKILRWDFSKQRFTNYLDSCGLQRLSGLTVVDLGQGQLDHGQYDQAPILGASGCAAVYRLQALAAVAEKQQYFDPAFFMYKEDVDLALRLQHAGWGAALVPMARVYHDRTMTSRGQHWWQRWLNRRSQSRANRRWSWRGQLLLIYKHWPSQNNRQRWQIVYQLSQQLCYISIFEPWLWSEVWPVWRQRRSLQRY